MGGASGTRAASRRNTRRCGLPIRGVQISTTGNLAPQPRGFERRRDAGNAGPYRTDLDFELLLRGQPLGRLSAAG